MTLTDNILAAILAFIVCVVFFVLGIQTLLVAISNTIFRTKFKYWTQL